MAGSSSATYGEGCEGLGSASPGVATARNPGCPRAASPRAQTAVRLTRWRHLFEPVGIGMDGTGRNRAKPESCVATLFGRKIQHKDCQRSGQWMDFRGLSQAISQGIAQAFDQIGQTADRIVDDLLDRDLKIIGGIVLVLILIKLVRSVGKRYSTSNRQRTRPREQKPPR